MLLLMMMSRVLSLGAGASPAGRRRGEQSKHEGSGKAGGACVAVSCPTLLRHTAHSILQRLTQCGGLTIQHGHCQCDGPRLVKGVRPMRTYSSTTGYAVTQFLTVCVFCILPLRCWSNGYAVDPQIRL